MERIPSPSFVIEEALLRKNLELLRKVSDESGAILILALKGFAMWKTFPLVKKYLSGATASSLNEARLTWEEMGSKAHAYAPAYHPEDFPELMNYCSHISFNSLSQYETFRDRLEKAGKSISAGLRINPGYSDVQTDMYNPCIPGSRLGVSPEDLEEGLPDGIEGLHFHALCESGSESLEKVIEEMEKRFSSVLRKVKWVNFGGGHLITRKDYNVELLISVIKRFKEKYGTEVILEPGAAIAWETGFLLATVLDIVKGNTDTAMLDVSFSAHMPDTLEMPYRPRIRYATDPTEGKPVYKLGGSSCLAGDFMNAYSFEKELKAGDRLIFEDMIHYTMVKTTMFNGIRHPHIGILRENGDFEIFRTFTYENYKERLS